MEMTNNAILENNAFDVMVGNYDYIDVVISDSNINVYRCKHCSYFLELHEWATNDDCSVNLEIRKINNVTGAFRNIDGCYFNDDCNNGSLTYKVNTGAEIESVNCCDIHIPAMVEVFGIDNIKPFS